MKKVVREEYKGLDKEKKEILEKSMGSASSQLIDFNKIRDEWKYGNNGECEWDMISDIFQEAIRENGIGKEDVEKIIKRCINEARNEKIPVSKATLPCLSYEAGKRLMEDIESTGIRQDVLDRSKMILEKLLKERKENEQK